MLCIKLTVWISLHVLQGHVPWKYKSRHFRDLACACLSSALLECGCQGVLKAAQSVAVVLCKHRGRDVHRSRDLHPCTGPTP